MERVCDFTVECPNNNDERDCGSCSFDKRDLCGWHNVGDSRQKWSLQSADRFIDHPIIPNSDSSGNRTGSFLIIDTSSGKSMIRSFSFLTYRLYIENFQVWC